MEFTDAENVPGLMIIIDFQKAFHRVEWNFILGCLEAFHFGLDFMQWIKTFFKKMPITV